MLDKNFVQFIRSSCCDALDQDSEYMRLQVECVKYEKAGDKDSCDDLHSEMETRAVEVCFMVGFNAAIQLVLRGGVYNDK